jgi:hypothetical protein
MVARPRLYGDESRIKAALARHIASASDLLDRLEGVKSLMRAAYGGPNGIAASLREMDWTEEVSRWRTRVHRMLLRNLAGDAPAILPTLTRDWPPETGKPRHARTIDWVEPWLRDSLTELLALKDLLGVTRGVAAVSPGWAAFAELQASGLIESAVIDGYVKDMRDPRTPKQLANAIGAAKELTEATLRAALDRFEETWRTSDDLNALMKKWRRRAEQLAPPDPTTSATLDRALAALGSLVTFLAAWRNAYGSGHGRSGHPPGVRRRHARLAVDGAEMAVRFIVTTMDDLQMLPALTGGSAGL